MCVCGFFFFFFTGFVRLVRHVSTDNTLFSRCVTLYGLFSDTARWADAELVNE